MRGRVIGTLSLITFLFLFVFFNGCKVSELVDPDTFEISDVISIDASPNQLKADGVDKLKVTATLQGDTADGKEVVFTTDAGRFAGLPTEDSTNKNTQEIKVTAAGKIAEVYLISSTEVKTAAVTATVSGTKNSVIYNYKISTDVEFTRVLPVSIYLSTNKSIIKADGQDTATLTVLLRPPDGIGTVSEKTLVIFEAMHPETGTEISHLYREAYSKNDGKAEVTLTSNKMGDYEITCSVPDANIEPAFIIIKFVPAG